MWSSQSAIRRKINLVDNHPILLTEDDSIFISNLCITYIHITFTIYYHNQTEKSKGMCVHRHKVFYGKETWGKKRTSRKPSSVSHKIHAEQKSNRNRNWLIVADNQERRRNQIDLWWATNAIYWVLSKLSRERHEHPHSHYIYFLYTQTLYQAVSINIYLPFWHSPI